GTTDVAAGLEDLHAQVGPAGAVHHVHAGEPGPHHHEVEVAGLGSVRAWSLYLPCDRHASALRPLRSAPHPGVRLSATEHPTQEPQVAITKQMGESERQSSRLPAHAAHGDYGAHGVEV